MTNISKSLRGGVEWRTPGKIKYQMHKVLTGKGRTSYKTSTREH
jgi:hypothetical protein